MAKPTGPAFGRPDDRLRVPTSAFPVGTALRSFAHPTRLRGSQRSLQESQQPWRDLGGKADRFVLRLIDESMAGAGDERDIRRKARLLEQDQKVGRLLRIDDVVLLAMDQHETGAVLVDRRVGGRRGFEIDAAVL